MPDSLKRFHGIHTGRPAAILGSGPSLRHLDPSWLKGFVVFTVNRSFVKYPDSDYHLVCCTGATRRKSWFEIKDHHCLVFMHDYARTPGCSFTPQLGLDAGIPRDRLFSFGTRECDSCRMSPDDEYTYRGTNGMHPSLHIAYLMGCSPIVLLGVDCQWEDGKLHFCDFDGQPDDPYMLDTVDNRVNGATAAMRTLGRFVDNQQDSDLAMWVEVANYNPGIDIRNASGGIVDCFRRINLTDLQAIA